MENPKRSTGEHAEALTPAHKGTGPLLQRDYWAVIHACRLTCSEVAALTRRRFADFAPKPFVTFRRSTDARPLEVGDELEVDIQAAGTATVRVIHVNTNSLTLGTVEGHPESGRITFGAYPNERDDVIFHIRSRARSSSTSHYLGFVAAGEPMQTNTWTDFIDRLAHTVGDGVIGAIQTETRKITEEDDNADQMAPTFIATGK